jgi:hypothetical protein
MRYEIVKADNLYVIVIEGRSLMKFRSRRQAAKVLAAAFQNDTGTEESGPGASADRSGEAA